MIKPARSSMFIQLLDGQWTPAVLCQLADGGRGLAELFDDGH